MAVPLTYTTGSRSARFDPFLDEIEAGVVYVNRRLTGKNGLGPYYAQQFAREQSRTIVAQ
jgi:hypothetical protein